MISASWPGRSSAGVPLRRGAAQRGRVARRAGRAVRPAATARSTGTRTRPTPHLPTLRERGAELLERSRDVWNEDDAHPAYERILDDLAPDEARILLLLLQGGPQPSVDVRTGGPVGMVNCQLVAPGLTMIGARAGCRYLDQVPSYLNNLFRLGLIWFSREPLRDPMEYQVVEAQPDVLAAMHSVKFAKVVRRSIHLTPFGEDFCRTCLVEDGRRGARRRSRRTPSRPSPTPGEPPAEAARAAARGRVERGHEEQAPRPSPRWLRTASHRPAPGRSDLEGAPRRSGRPQRDRCRPGSGAVEKSGVRPTGRGRPTSVDRDVVGADHAIDRLVDELEDAVRATALHRVEARRPAGCTGSGDPARPAGPARSHLDGPQRQ